MTTVWNVSDYHLFLEQRMRATKDLIAAIPPSFQPRTVYDLGCGSGSSTCLLKNKWPDAVLTGIDSSSDMLEYARCNYPEILFNERSIENLVLDTPVDCLFANASLHWISHHEHLFPKLLKLLNPGGLFAVQIPNNFHAPSHQIMINLLRKSPDWNIYLDRLSFGVLNNPRYQAALYYDLLKLSGAQLIQLWETTYFHEMASYQDIFNWLKGTGLRPVLSVMSDSEKIKFETTYIHAIAKAYPKQPNGSILLPFRRLFFLAFSNISRS